MKLQAVVDSLDDLPEHVRHLYRPEGDQFVIDADLTVHPDVAPLARAYARVRQDGEALAQKRDAMTLPPDFSIEEWHRLRARDAHLNKDRKAEVEALEASLAEQHAQADERLKRTRALRDRLLIESELQNALAQVAVKPQLTRAAIAMLTPECTVIEKDGEPYAVRNTEFGRQPVGQFVRSWSRSEEASDFLRHRDRQPDDGSFTALVRQLRAK